ncbi:MAG: hypothetical protein A2268_00910 [Candidatus Raymondbacteria bacterium RifOxyA12_full_50_37]|uniref:Uncharacterized protein n=1 Tax=Candidatus Raymondbacteria bacterium RIFOXYD12_FULL_49_13 TaxID=1817890 RepID=A0A1F7FFM0_UNCRA|nr:MAG: hypothetical protein A2268_00910 [Candidatus Raymondbacteria bacterium RifOxyA12_full_50_37]OGJ86363.1 MAG: hypothetical protein A2248_13875 [Candidatus Raymondbacteria bacterium RIFOXYA2_FULL_49_16]OGJ95533.1 MAG: hypothetical protein A2453_12650 [Candidatus Raymondbacteria bacterium RIFOXYC2_FULL_50_21]OGJ96104.1 MAG: hypothetical protein A2487_01735 [Candidatus Raymondbacteria bacterium RifOxyC12_full_50_8]OGJ96256.1 MAG: hypothetical protein A2350_02320 [Candidatus Raymondbacteria b
MGRTLHYTLLRNDAFPITEKDWDRIIAATEAFNTKFTWTCERVGFHNVDYYPRWPSRFKNSRLPVDGDAWEYINARYKRLEKRNLNHLQIVRRMLSEKFIAIHGDNPDKIDLQQANGFTKVAGNEWNAFLTVAWIVTVSTMLPNHEIELNDEGHFLKCPLVIKNGKARPNCMRMVEYIHWLKLKIREGIVAYQKYLPEAEENYKTFKDVGTKSIGFFCRPVDRADFEQYPKFDTVTIDMSGEITGNPLAITGGFEGEYYGKVSQTEAILKAKKCFENIFKSIFPHKEAKT